MSCVQQSNNNTFDMAMNEQAKKVVPYLNDGYVIKDKFRIEALIGKGGFGHIYKVTDVRFDMTFAVKVSFRRLEPLRMILEQKILLALSDTEHSPAMLASGTCGEFYYIVMELLGPNLTELRRSQTLKRFSVATTLRLGQQWVDALKNVHEVGFVHRDVKPSNVCIGIKGEDIRRLYLVDFGMARRFRQTDGSIRRKRAYAGIRGTIRYISLNIHDKGDQSPVDDLWSMLYSMIELGESALPWRLVADQSQVHQHKTSTAIEDMCNHLPKTLRGFSDYLETFEYGQIPDYNVLKTILQSILPNDVNQSTPYDWEVPPAKSSA